MDTSIYVYIDGNGEVADTFDVDDWDDMDRFADLVSAMFEIDTLVALDEAICQILGGDADGYGFMDEHGRFPREVL